eukprot:g20172.t1
MCRHLLALQSSLPQLRAFLSQTCKGPLLFFILRRIHNLNLQFYSALSDIKNRKYTKLTGACHPTQASSTPQVPTLTQDLPHNVPGTIDYVVTIAAPTDATDHITSADAGHATSGTTSHATSTAIHTADTAASVAETKSSAYIKDTALAANIKDTPANATPPTATDAAPPTTPTAISSTANTSPHPCQVYTIPPDLPLTEDE